MRRTLTARVVVLFAALFTLSTSAADPNTLERCVALADEVAESCPNACVNRHCVERCIPPFAETGRCGRCQENCSRVCESMDEHRRQRCHADASAEKFPSGDQATDQTHGGQGSGLQR